MKASGRDIKFFVISFIISLVLGAGYFFTQVKSGVDFLLWLFAMLIFTLVIMTALRLIVWFINKVR